MSRTEKILDLNNEIEAHLIDGLLNERSIPHLIRSFHDSAYDGLWQAHSGWGRLDAPEEYREEIIRIYNEMSAANHLPPEDELPPEG
ncbi:MAG TPA: hypothetical protein DCY25_05605 [Bacteroidales bacterium]|nr:hypothetical protein [Bacteroidales bacterium]